MSVGDLIALAVALVCIVSAIAPVRQRDSRPTSVRFWLAYLVNELPFVVATWVVAVVSASAWAGESASPSGIVGAALATAVLAGLVVIVVRATRARDALDEAGQSAVGAHAWPLSPSWGTARWARIVLWPLPWLVRPHVDRRRDIPYGPDEPAHRLDLYRPTGRAATGPVLIHLHGGAFRGGRKNLDAQPLVNHLVARGWVCVSADYRLEPRAVFPDQLIDVKRVITWARAHAVEWGADPGAILIAGSSAGGHLAATAALTANRHEFQPGFESVDTSVRAAVCLYPYPGPIATRGPASSPIGYIGPHAPSFFVAWASHDTLVAPAESRAFAAALADGSHDIVLAAELPGAHHCFDLFHSIRAEHLADAIESFAGHVLDRT